MRLKAGPRLFLRFAFLLELRQRALNAGMTTVLDHRVIAVFAGGTFATAAVESEHSPVGERSNDSLVLTLPAAPVLSKIFKIGLAELPIFFVPVVIIVCKIKRTKILL